MAHLALGKKREAQKSTGSNPSPLGSQKNKEGGLMMREEKAKDLGMYVGNSESFVAFSCLS